MTKTGRQTHSFMQATLSGLTEKLSEGMSKPVAKFIRDMLFSICSNGTSSVQGIAQNILDGDSTKKTSERLYCILDREGLDVTFRDSLMNIACSKLEEDSLIIFDGNNTEKPYTKKLEGSKPVHNGSKATQTRDYDLLNILACLENSHGYQLLPVGSDFISTDLELDSTKEIMFDCLIDITIKSNGRGIFVFHRG